MKQTIEQSETRQRVIESAEYLFATQGYDATSIREITKRAGANTAAVNYYFSDKNNLYTTVFMNRLKVLREFRIHAMQQVMNQTGDQLTIEQVCRTFANAFLAPLSEEKESRLLMLLFMREMMDSKLPKEMFHREMAEPMHQIMHQALTSIHPELQPHHTFMCLHSLVAQLIHFIQMRDLVLNYSMSESISINETDMLEHVIGFTVAGIELYVQLAQIPEAQINSDKREEST